ncbi:phage structural protein [Listeria fleischmannii]|uniref:Gp15 n=1 Tax=Listeria fleischmannii FSL S10-1203 TaxID=1265822 RepID=W7D4B5_9LIST|nr:hypothetical protein [Listeria fleischmannii]EUJ44042.1 gp15 [Listeria fleischmannii FSL S10-1203]
MAADEFMYDANEVQTVRDGVTLFGFGDGDMVKGSRDSNRAEAKVDAQGFGTMSKNNNSLGTVTVTISASSPCYPQLVKDAKAGKIAPLWVHHKKEFFGGTKAFIEKDPDVSYGKESGQRDFVFKILDYDHDFNS